MTNGARGALAAGSLVIVLLAALSSASCAPRTRAMPGVEFLIGVSQANLSEPWRIAMNREIREEASRYGQLKLIYSDAADSSERQIEDVQRLMDLGIDLLIISPTESRALTPIVRDVYKRIPVIVLDRAVEGYDYSLFIGPDNERLGREAGALVSDLLGKAGGSILEIQGRSGSPPAMARSEGLREILATRGDIRLEEPIVADWIRDKAEDEFAARIDRVTRVHVVLAQNDAMAFGAWRAARRAGRSDIRFIGIDGLPGPNGGIELVREGVLAATFICPTGGKEAVIYALDILLRKEGIPKKIFLRPVKVTPETLAKGSDDLPRSQYLSIPPGRRLVLGFAQVGSESEWRLANTKSIKAAAAKAGIELCFEDGEQRQENQIAAIRSFIKKNVDVIAFSPVVESGWEDVLKEAKAAGIPVILLDRAVDLRDDSLWLTFMGSDFMEEGRSCARWLMENMKGRERVGIVELQGTVGSAPAIDRKIGFEEVIGDFPEFRIIASESGDFTRELGYLMMKRILAKEGSLVDAVFAHNDDMAIGAIQAIEEVGLRPGKDIVIVSIDAAHGAFKAMIEGKLNCTVECNPLLGPQLMKAIMDYRDGKDLPLRMITSEGVFPAATARRDMVGREY